MFTRQQAEKLHQMIKDGDTASAQQFIRNQGERAKELCALEVPRDGTCLHVAARSGNADLVRCVLDLGICVDLKLVDGHVVAGFTALHAAVKAGQVEIVKLLLDKGAQVNIQEADGQTPLHVACLYSKTDIVKLLVERGSDVNTPDYSSQYPIHTSILRGPNEIPQVLVDNGANIHVTDKDSQTVLHYASEWSNIDLINLFISNGANPNAQDSEGKTPLHVTTDDEIFGLLVQCGADSTIRDRRGKPPRDGHIDTSKQEYQNINKALGKHSELSVNRSTAAHRIQERNMRVFSPGPPLPETELKMAKTNMLQELQRKVPMGTAEAPPSNGSRESKSLVAGMAATGIH